MILNHKAAIELLLDDTVDIGFNRYTICNLHALLSDHLLADQGAGGRLRSKPVGVTGTLFHPLGVPQMIEECFDVLLGKAASIADPFEQAFFVMVQLPYLQPFVDVNKRVSRLAANIPLIRMNICPLSFKETDRRGDAPAWPATLGGDHRDRADVSSSRQHCPLHAETLRVRCMESRLVV